MEALLFNLILWGPILTAMFTAAEAIEKHIKHNFWMKGGNTVIPCKTYEMNELTIAELAAMTKDPAICFEFMADGKIKVWYKE
jgi:hypothetical protein